MSVSQSSSLFAFALYVRFPTVLREPLRASVTFWEATHQSNYPPDTVLPPRFRARGWKPGTSRVVSQGWLHQLPKTLLQSLPPILSEMPQTPISSCSKGARGLSVWPRVLGIFTETAISPSPSLRQRPSRYAIRAGRNFAFIPCYQGRGLIPSPHQAPLESGVPPLSVRHSS